MVAIPKQAFDAIVRRQDRTEAALKHLARTVKELSQEEELRPEVAKRLDRQSMLMDQGKGIYLKNMKEYRAFIRSL